MKTSKLFHSVVILGMALAAEAACSDDKTPAPSPTADGGTTGASSSGNAGDASAASDAFAGWVCCG